MGGMISSEQVERHMQQLREDAVNELRQQLKAASERVKQLERINAMLAAEVDRQRPVVEAAIAWCDTEESDGEWANNTVGVQLVEAVDTYEHP